MLKIKKCHGKVEWIVFNPHNFEALHTHCRCKRVAKKIKYNVEHRIIPTSENIRTLESHIRVSGDRKYNMEIQKRIEELSCRTSSQLAFAF
ncbi:MAG: hypothetical protein Q4G61_02015 [Tissierellia bacterium]|nr:hypothetical protein [Tissierellia bacterium]